MTMFAKLLWLKQCPRITVNFRYLLITTVVD